MYIHWLHEIADDQEPLVGGKGANLGRLARLDVSVPPGFCVSLLGYRHFISGAEANRALESFLRDLGGADYQRLLAQATEFQRALLAAAIPSTIAQEVFAAYRDLRNATRDSEPLVAVRSSATAEDMPDASFAGQYDTYLSIRGEEALLAHIVRCWASLWNPHAIHYRRTNGIDHRRVSMAVVIQQMVPAVSAGVLFTANPISRDPSQILISASWGLGEGVVSGAAPTDTYVIQKGSGSLLSRTIAYKDSMIQSVEGAGAQQVPVPEASRRQPSLTEDQVAQLHALGMTVEDYYGVPQDIEWAYGEGRLHLLQARPITGLSNFPTVIQTQPAR